MATVEQISTAHRRLASLTATEESRDGLVEATVGPHGDLRALRLNPRLYRVQDAEALANSIRDTVYAAAKIASREALDAAAPLLPPGTEDFMFDPLLHELDRVGSHEALRRKVAAAQELSRSATGTAESDDGLITATVGGRGELILLTLGMRIYRSPNARLLADQIVATVREAAAVVHAEIERSMR